MELYFCKLTPKSSLHLGERENIREGTDILIHSDTLFSAFCHNYLLLYGEKKLESLLQKFLQNTPPFLISSSFPWSDNIFYFPIPLNQVPHDKKIKKILFIDKSGFEKLLNGENIENLVNEYKTIPDSEGNKPWETVDVPRIGLNRLTNHPGEQYFHFGEVFYKKNSGLFFLIEFKDINFKSEFEATLNLLVDEGIGGDRTCGKGLFERPEFGEINLDLPLSDSYITLSLFCPKKEEIFDIKEGYYEIVERKGYIYSPYGQSLRKKSIRMFKEGSVFKSKKEGYLVDITPEIFSAHKIYRYGFCFGLPCQLEVKK